MIKVKNKQPSCDKKLEYADNIKPSSLDEELVRLSLDKKFVSRLFRVIRVLNDQQQPMVIMKF